MFQLIKDKSISAVFEIIGYTLLPIISWLVAYKIGYRLSVPGSHSVLVIALILFISPTLEEIIFRGLLQDWLAKVIPNKLLMILILNIAFAILHYRINTNLTYLLDVFICGVIFSRVKIRFNNLYYPIGLHIYYNMVFYFANT